MHFHHQCLIVPCIAVIHPSHALDLLQFPPKITAVKTTIMAAKHRSISEELLSCVSQYNYHSRVTCISDQDLVTIKDFKNSRLGKKYNVNRTKCVVKNIVDYDHLFRIFCNYSDEEPDQVRKSVVWTVRQNPRLYENVGEIVLSMKNLSLPDWLDLISNRKIYGDELLLFILCKQWHRHAMIVCNNRHWSTLDPKGVMDEDTLMSVCDLCFVYVRPGVFAELSRKPAPGRRKTSTLTWDNYSYNAPSTSTRNTTVTRMQNLENFVETIHWTSDSITLETSAVATTSAPSEFIELDSGQEDTIMLTGSHTNEDSTSDGYGELIEDYQDQVENQPETNVPGMANLDYSSDILNDSDSDAIDNSNHVVTNTTSSDDPNQPYVQDNILQIKEELSYITDGYTSGFMSDGGTSSWSHQSSVSTLKTLSLRALRGTDDWPLPSLKWLCCNATQYLSGNHLHLCWIFAMQRKGASNQIPVLKNALGLAIKNGNSSGEILALDNQEMYHNEIMMENQNVMKNINTNINLEVADNTKNGNIETPKIGNELPMGMEGIGKQTSIDLNLEKIGELKNGNSTTMKNRNTPINDPHDEDDTVKNASNIRNWTIKLRRKMETC